MSLKEFIKGNYWTTILLLVALLACLYTIYSSATLNEECNQRWEDTLTARGLGYLVTPINISEVKGSYPYPTYDQQENIS